MLNWVLEITGTLHPLCKPQHFSLLGARAATRQIIRTGGSTRPQDWGKGGAGRGLKSYEEITDRVTAGEAVPARGGGVGGTCACVEMG